MSRQTNVKVQIRSQFLLEKHSRILESKINSVQDPAWSQVRTELLDLIMGRDGGGGGGDPPASSYPEEEVTWALNLARAQSLDLSKGNIYITVSQ